MSMKKKDYKIMNADVKKEFWSLFFAKKSDLIGVLLFIVLTIFSLIWFETTIYQLLMSIFAIIFIVAYFVKYIFATTLYEITAKVLEQNADFKVIAEQLKQNPELLEKMIAKELND